MAPSAWKECMCWRQLKSVTLFKVNFAGCSIFTFYVGLSHICTSLILIWLAWEDNTSYYYFRKDLYITSYPTLLILLFIYNKTHSYKGPWCWDKFNFLCNHCGHSLYSSLSFMSVLAYLLWDFFHCSGSLIGQPFHHTAAMPSRHREGGGMISALQHLSGSFSLLFLFLYADSEDSLEPVRCSPG